MKKLVPMSRAEFIQARIDGRKFCWATLYERQDYKLWINPDKLYRPIREITNEPHHWHRNIG